MSTVYTINGKVLKNSANDKWLIKKEGPLFDEVTIGTQTWMAKNLAINDDGTGISIVNNVTANNVNFGTQYYYTWAAAVRVANSIPGWHLPTNAEWETLINYIGSSSAGTKLKSISGWNGRTNTDDYGFTALPTGYYYTGSLYDTGLRGYFWTNTENGTNVYIRYLDSAAADVRQDSYFKEAPLTVRLVKDT